MWPSSSKCTSKRDNRAMLMEEAIEYTPVAAGTFRKWVAHAGIPAHG